jgi:hypothetical protein
MSDHATTTMLRLSLIGFLCGSKTRSKIVARPIAVKSPKDNDFAVDMGIIIAAGEIIPHYNPVKRRDSNRSRQGGGATVAFPFPMGPAPRSAGTQNRV